MRHRRRPAAGLALLIALSGCTGEDPDAPPAAVDTVPAPAPSGPLTVLRATVDLSPAVPGVPASPGAAVAAPDGGAFVVLSTADLGLPHYLATVAATPDGYAVTGSVPIPRLRPVWDMHVLGNGTVLVSGQFRGDRPGYGFLAVDPAAGKVRRSVVVPFEEGTDLAHGSSVLSPDGATITLFLSSFVDGRQLDLLMAADASNGRILGGRDLSEEVRAVSESGVGPWSTWMFPRPDGGVSLVFDAYPPGVGISGVPTLVRYDARLEPIGAPVAMAAAAARARLRAAAGAPDGSVVVRAEVPDGTWLLGMRPGSSSSTRLLELAGTADDDALVVDPGREWVLMPAPGGARAVDLTDGGTTRLDVGCEADVDLLLPGHDGTSALMLGRCDSPAGGTPTLWVTGPPP